MNLFDLPVKNSDVVYTPRRISKLIIDYLKPTGKILDPCRGDGSFFEQLSGDVDFCEIREGKDFFLYSQMVDWIIGNPPYSIFYEFLEHSFTLAENVSFLVPTNKIFQRQKVMNLINNWGGVVSIIVFGSGSLLNFPFGFSVGNFHFQKGYKGETKLIMGMDTIYSFREFGGEL
jgi:hypothetical protein